MLGPTSGPRQPSQVAEQKRPRYTDKSTVDSAGGCGNNNRTGSNYAEERDLKGQGDI